MNCKESIKELSALSTALLCKRKDIVKEMIENGAIISSEEVAAALHSADLDQLKLVLSVGVNPSEVLLSGSDLIRKFDDELYATIRGISKVTLLHMALMTTKFTEIANFLIDDGRIDVNFVDSLGDHPLNYAAYRNQPREMFEKLLEAGSKIDVKGAGNRTALDIAITLKRSETEEILRSLGANSNPEAEPYNP